MITHAASRKQYYTVLLDRPEMAPLLENADFCLHNQEEFH